MICGDIINSSIAILIGYFLGSIPSAYLVTRFAIGQDIRKLGGGNVGGLNVYREVGPLPAFVAAIFDLGKGAASVAIAHWLLALPPLFVLLAGLASVIGHNWMIFLRFSGGKGMAATFGALAVLLPVYGYPEGLLILSAVILLPFIITRNVALSMGTGLVALPFIIWLGMHSGIGIIVAIITGLVILLKFLPTARTAWAESKGTKAFIFNQGKRDKR